MDNRPKRDRKKNPPLDSDNGIPPDKPTEEKHLETTVVVREFSRPEVRTTKGKIDGRPYTVFSLTDWAGGKVIGTHAFTINAPLNVAISILQTVARRNLDLSKKQFEAARTPEGVTL